MGIAHVGLDGQWLRVNQKLCDIVGYTRQELSRLTFQDMTCPEDLEADLALVEKALSGEIATYTIEKRYIRKGGSLVWIQLTVALARGPRNEPQYFISIVQDIEERKQLEEQLRHSQKMEAVGRLAGGVAHDFNNMLTVISGYGEMIANETAGEPAMQSRAEAICAAAGRAAVLTQQLLAFSRRQVVQPRIVDLNDVVVKMQQMLHRLIGEKVVLSTVLLRDPALVKVDPGQMEQVIMNLAVNAQDSMPDGGPLTIEVGRRESAGSATVTLEVRDAGKGMTAEVLAHLYEPFFTTKPRGKGTGLGLSIVYGIIKQAGGTIQVETQVGRGTTFRIVLPEASSVEAEPEARRIPMSGRHRGLRDSDAGGGRRCASRTGWASAAGQRLHSDGGVLGRSGGERIPRVRRRDCAAGDGCRDAGNERPGAGRSSLFDAAADEDTLHFGVCGGCPGRTGSGAGNKIPAEAILADGPGSAGSRTAGRKHIRVGTDSGTMAV